MSEPFLRPSDRKKLSEGLASCARCADRIDQMRQAQIDPGEDADRVEYYRRLISGALEVDALSSRKSEAPSES